MASKNELFASLVIFFLGVERIAVVFLITHTVEVEKRLGKSGIVDSSLLYPSNAALLLNSLLLLQHYAKWNPTKEDRLKVLLLHMYCCIVRLFF